MSVFSKKRALASLAGLAGVAVVIAGCADSSGGGGNAGGPGVDFGASVEEWQAAFDEAFAERDDMEIVLNNSISAVSTGAPAIQAMADKIEEYSNGHVSVEISWSDSIAPITESLEALQDGREDIGNLGTFLRPADFPIMGVFGHEVDTTRGPSVIADSLSSYGAFVETYWDTPEVIAEFEDKGLAVLNPQSVIGQNVLACAEPWTSLAELQGKQIRVASQVQAKQAEALGAVPVTVAYPDLFESLQRGIVDCLIIGLSTMVAFPGMTDLAPYMINPESAAFGINTNSFLAGVNWPEWPLVLQQLVFDAQAESEMATLEQTPDNAQLQFDDVTAAGGAFLEFDQDAEDALKASNDAVVEAWSDFPLLDGEDFRERLFANLEKWDALVVEAGYSDAPFSATDEWLAPIDIAAFADAYYQEIVVPNRPS